MIPVASKFGSLEQQYGLPSGLLDAVARTESNYNPNAVSPKGAQGLFQFMPATAKAYGINPLDPEQAAVGAARMYGDLLKQYKGDLPSALAAYNWGSGNLQKKGMQNMPEETRNYIAKILPKVQQYADSGQIMSDASGDEELAALEAELAALKAVDPEEQALEAELAALKKAAPVVPSEKGALESFGQGLGRGVTFGFLDELAAGALTPFLNEEGQSYGQTYEQLLGDARASQGVAQESNPVAFGVGEVTGAVPSSIAAGGALAKLGGAVAPNVASKIGGAIAANPIKSTAGLSGLSGSIYGYGTGEGGASERLQSAAGAGAIGAVAGAAGGSALQGISGRLAQSQTAQKAGEAVKSNVVKVAERFGRKAPKVADDLVTAEQKFIPQLAQKEGEIFSKTAGQRLQNAEIQRLENSALAGNLSDTANQAMKDAITIQNNQFRGAIGKIAGGKDADINLAMDNVTGAIKTAADDAWGGVNNAYKLAREGGGVKVNSQDIRQGLFKNVAALRRENQFDLSQMPQAKNVVKRLARYTKDTKSERMSAVKLNELENWRTMATTASKNAQGSEKTFLQGMVRKYDDFMEQTASEAVDIGDAEAIKAFREAVKSRRQYGKIYESNKLVDEIVTGVKSVDDVTKDLIGAGSIKGKRQMAKNLDAIMKAAGDEMPAVQADLQGAFARRMVQKSESGFLPDNPEMKMLSPAKLKTQLEELFVDQREFATKLYGADAVKTAEQAIKELDVIASKQPKVGSSSGSGEVIEGLIKRGGALARIPFVAPAIESLKKTAASSKVTSGLSEFVAPEVQSKLFGKAVKPVSAAIGASSGSMVAPERNALKVDITKSPSENEVMP